MTAPSAAPDPKPYRGWGTDSDAIDAPRMAAPDVALKSALHRRLLADPVAGSAGREALRDRLSKLMRDEAPLVGGARAARLLDELIVEVDGLGPLEALLADPDVSEIMLNGPGRAYVERNGRLEAITLALDAAACRDGLRDPVARALAARLAADEAGELARFLSVPPAALTS